MRVFIFILLIALPGYALAKLTQSYDWRILIAYTVVINLLTFLLYRTDKKRAQTTAWRISEKTLHLCELVGGWPAALLAQWKFRHKTRKTAFQIVFWLIVILHQYLAYEVISGWQLLKRIQ
jgi:uncharacterized membrane protein YsdA (DUF1294 family)